MKFSSWKRDHLLKNSSQVTVSGLFFLSHFFFFSFVCFPDHLAAYECNFRWRIASYIVWRLEGSFVWNQFTFVNDQKTEMKTDETAGLSWKQRCDQKPGPCFPVKDSFHLDKLVLIQDSQVFQPWTFFLCWSSPLFCDVWHICFKTYWCWASLTISGL